MGPRSSGQQARSWKARHATRQGRKKGGSWRQPSRPAFGRTPLRPTSKPAGHPGRVREERPDLGVPLLEEVRDGRTQAVHSGDAVLLDADGHIDHQWGHGDQGAYWRSAAKPLQALAFVETGAFDALAGHAGLDDSHLAIACSSHNGEPVHVDAAHAILAAAGLKGSDLGCGAHEPMGGATLGGPMPKGGWTALHNNCSGKHAAMLATAKHNG